MVRFIVDKVRPHRGFGHAFHLSFLAVLPLVLLVLVRLDFNLVALTVLILSKWRMLAVHPRHWIAHVRTNAVDIIVGVSILIFMMASSAFWVQIVWVALFELWLLGLKPRTESGAVALQALVAQGLGLASIFYAYEEASTAVIVLSFWFVTYFSARHFFNAFDETRGRLLSAIWAYFAASLAWILSHWLLFIGPFSQPAVIVIALAYGLAGLYYLERKDRLSVLVRRQIILTLFTLLFVIIIFSDWGDKAV